MAEIFLARQWGEGGFFRDVVVKRLFRHLAEHPSVQKKFQYEARLLAHLCHPNIPQVLDLGFVEGSWYMVMEYVEGHDVADLWRAGVRAGEPMPLPVSIGIVMQACEALHHAHERRDRAGNPLRIVHRDVTPHNLMLTRDGVAKLMDFGVAKTAARTDTTGAGIKGTLSYMSPEQVRGRPLDRRADVFSIGVILYELTTGTRLFRGTDVEVMTAVVESDAPPPTARVPGYPTDLEEIVLAAIARSRRQRVKSAAHLALALEQFAMRHGLAVGPRGVARYVNRVLPAERVLEEGLGLVVSGSHEQAVASPEGEQTQEEVLTFEHPPPEGPWDVPAPIDLSSVEEIHDFDALTDPESPAPLKGFDDSSGERPVVLLGEPKKKPGAAPDHDYLAELERRLEDDEPE
jgi:serine/threonine-protein kinase